MIEYNFDSKKIFDEIIFTINVKPPYEMLYDLANGFLQTTEGVEQVLSNIGKVSSGEIEKYSWGGSDYCVIDTYKSESKIFYDFGENEKSISTIELVNLLQDWKKFLIENKS